MPHGESLWSLLWPQGYANLVHALGALGLGTAVEDPLTGEVHYTAYFQHGHFGAQHVIGAILTLLVVSVVALAANQQVADPQKAIVPEDKLTLRTFVEMFVSTVYGMMSDIMGAKAARFFLPLVGTCAFFIFFSNVSGLVPGLLPPTNSLNTTFACAIVIFLTTHVFGVKEHGLAYFAHFFGPVRSPGKAWWAWPFVLVLMILMFGIEVISHTARPISLALRLMANMFADHLVLGIFLSAPLALVFVVPIPIVVLGILVCVVQTLVFCILSCVYISMAVAHEEH